MIKKVNLDDLQSCADVIKESFITIAEKFDITQGNAPSYVAFSVNSEKLKEQYLNGREMYVYTLDEQMIGFFSLDFSGKSCELNNLCVLTEYQHNGVGRELLNFAINRAFEKKSDKLTLSIVEENTVLKEWYASFGFIHTHTKKYDFFPFNCGYMELAL